MMKILKNFSNKNWYDITLGEFNQLVNLGDSPTLGDLLSIIYKVDYKTLPIGKINKYKLDFLNTPVPRTPIKKYYKLNGVKYCANFDITKINGAQFIDFRNYSSNGAKLEDILSVCLVPKGHKYNDGYDISKVKKDALEMKITDAQTIGFFFLNQSLILLSCTQSSLIQNLEEMKEPQLQEAISRLKNLDLNNLMSYLYS